MITRTNRFLIVYIPLALVIVFCSIAYERSRFQEEKQNIIERERRYISEQKRLITDIFPLVAADLTLLTELQEVREFTAEASAHSFEPLEQKLLSFLTFKSYYAQLRLLDAKGIERIRVNRAGQDAVLVPTDELQDKSKRSYFSEAIGLPPGGIYVSSLDLNIEHGVVEKPLKPVIRFAVPIVGRQENKGVLIVNYFGRHLFRSLERTSVSGEHGDLLIVNDCGYWLKGPQPEDEWGFAIPDRAERGIQFQYPDVWDQIKSSASGRVEAAAGIFVYEKISPLSAFDTLSSATKLVEDCNQWTVISFVDNRAIAKQVSSVRLQLLALNIVVLIVLAAGLVWIIRIKSGYSSSQKHLSDAENMIDQLRGSLNNGFVRYSPDGRITEFNETYRKMLGYEDDELKGMLLRELTTQDSYLVERGIYEEQLVSQGQSEIYEKQEIRKDGSFIPVEKCSFICYDDQCVVESIWAIVSDISQRKDYEKKLNLLASVFENTVEGIVITDLDGTIEEVNPGFTAITGYNLNEAIGKNPSLLKSDHHGSEFYADMWRVLKETGHWSGEIWNRRKNGESYPERLSINAVTDYKGHVSHYIGVFYDITDIKQGEEQLHHQAHHDALTGLPNRTLFIDRLENALIRSRRSNSSVGVMFLDMDNFKNINDSLGHNVGDLLLRKIATTLGEIVREEDTVARFGGDEFVILLPAPESERDVCKVAKRILATFSEPIKLDDNESYASFSIGISLSPGDGFDAQSLIKNADLAMYRAKEEGKNSYRLFTEKMNQDVSRRLDLENNLRRALERDEFVLFYQPKVDIATGTITGCEALVRWNRDGNLISPAEFIPVAEETGLIVPIGEWILRRACRDAQSWVDHGYPLSVAINLSPRQFKQKNLNSMILMVLEETGLSPELLELEITEGIVMDDVKGAINILNLLREKGIHFAIDDFGTGYSSLQYLRQLPLDTLKIDRAFIKDLPKNKEDAAITQATLSMAHALGLKVVAEGVETESQLHFLRNSSCEQLQGYLFSKPVEQREILGLLQRGKRLE